jgi:cobalt transporter subunit CbtB
MMMQNQSATLVNHQAETVPVTISKPLQLVGVFLLGSIILFGAGFVNAAAVHNAAHDTRHSQGFPCH